MDAAIAVVSSIEDVDLDRRRFNRACVVVFVDDGKGSPPGRRYHDGAKPDTLLQPSCGTSQGCL